MRLSAVIALALLLYSAYSHRAAETPEAGATTLHINAQRLRVSLEERELGRISMAALQGLGYSESELGAREYIAGRMKQAGLEVRTDAGGNHFGSRAGTAKLPVLLFGSHIDSVLKGGNFDGVGSLNAVEVVRALNENGVTIRHPLEVVVGSTKKAILSA